MTFQRTLKLGDLIKIKGSPGTFVVVRSEHHVSQSYDGDYWVDEIDVVPVKLDELPNLNLKKPLKSFYFQGGCMTGKGKCIKDADVTVIGTTKFDTRVEVTYEVSKVKLF